MRKIKIALSIATLFTIQSSFADVEDFMSSFKNKPCATIAAACQKAGFVRGDNADKRFWFDCMKPILLGKTVKDVTVNAKTVKACRTDKIEEIKKDLSEFQKVS